MEMKDMLEALDLDAAATSSGGEPLQIDTTTVNRPTVNQAPNAMVMDRWAKRQGRQLHDKLSDEKISCASDYFQNRPIHALDETDLADLHTSVFLPNPELVQDGACSDRKKWQYFNELNETSSFHELRSATVLDDAATELAIERLADGLNKARGDGDDQGDGDTGDSSGDFCVSRAASSSAVQALRDVNDLNDARNGLGLGNGAGGQTDIKESIALYKKLRQSPYLQKIINLAGKYILFGQSQQRKKVAHGYDDMVGVTLGGDLARLARSEFLAMGIPALEDDVCRRLLDNQAMIQEFHGNEPVAKGPMIILIDESGSMEEPGNDGLQRIQHAKALSLAFAYMARQQARWCALVAWSNRNQRRGIVLPPGKWDHEQLLQWLTEFFCCGTEPPVSDMPEIYETVGAPKGITDIVYITDGDVYIDPGTIAAFNIWKQEVNAKVITLIVSASGGQMAQVSNEIHIIKSLGLNEATGRVLSI